MHRRSSLRPFRVEVRSSTVKLRNWRKSFNFKVFFSFFHSLFSNIVFYLFLSYYNEVLFVIKMLKEINIGFLRGFQVLGYLMKGSVTLHSHPSTRVYNEGQCHPPFTYLSTGYPDSKVTQPGPESQPHVEILDGQNWSPIQVLSTVDVLSVIFCCIYYSVTFKLMLLVSPLNMKIECSLKLVPTCLQELPCITM